MSWAHSPPRWPGRVPANRHAGKAGRLMPPAIRRPASRKARVLKLRRNTPLTNIRDNSAPTDTHGAVGCLLLADAAHQGVSCFPGPEPARRPFRPHEHHPFRCQPRPARHCAAHAAGHPAPDAARRGRDHLHRQRARAGAAAPCHRPHPADDDPTTETRSFGANHNTAFSHCRTRYFAVLNPDLRFERDPFPALLRGFAAPERGLMAPQIYSPEAGWKTPPASCIRHAS